MTESEKLQLKNEYEDRGYVLVRSFFDQSQTRALLEEVTTAKTRIRSVLGRSKLTFREHLYHGSPLLRSVLSSHEVVGLMTGLLGPDLWVRRDTAIIKAPGGEEFPWHQDNGYNQLLDSYAQFWVALTPMFEANGGVCLVPSSHTKGLMRHRMADTHKVWQGKPEGAVAVEAEPGDVLVFSSFILHRTGPNQTQSDRVAYLAEFMERQYLDPYTKPPYFMVSKAGRPQPLMTRFYEGNTSFRNHLRYVGPRTKRRIEILKGHVKRFLNARGW
jgi:ectoine hydroxylase-related dioxygenase (phytanoyl-CoA dioxygenase family)